MFLKYLYAVSDEFFYATSRNPCAVSGSWQGEWEQSASDVHDQPLSEQSAVILDIMNDADVERFVNPRSQIRWAALDQWLRSPRTRECLQPGVTGASQAA